MAKQPNILMIMTDQHKFNALGFKNSLKNLSPNLDKLAAESVVFDNAYTPSPVCAPARASIKTGMYPPGCGVVENWLEFKDGVEFMPQRLKNCGYQTGLVGKLHFVPADRDYGFEYNMLHDAPYSVYADDDKYSEYIKWLKANYFDEKGIDPVELFDDDENAFDSDIRRFITGGDFRTEEEHDIPWTYSRSVDFLKNRDKEKPFFLFASFFGPHQPYMTPAPWNSMFSPDDIELPENFEAAMENSPIFNTKNRALSDRLRKEFTSEGYKELIALNYGQIAMLDCYIGKLFDELKSEGVWDDTVIIFVSDHGDHLGSYGLFFKGEMYDSCCKVPLMIKAGKCGGETRRQNVNTLDLYGTILDYAGDVDWKKDNIESRSLCGLVKDGNAEWENTTCSIIGKYAENALCMMKSGDLKLIRLACGETDALYELYDLKTDGNESENIYEKLKDTDEVKSLKKALDDWYFEQLAKYPPKENRKLHNKQGA